MRSYPISRIRRHGSVIPAKAGIQTRRKDWTPAFAGVTRGGGFPLLVAAALIALWAGCTRDESAERTESPIRKVELPTPKPAATAEPEKVARKAATAVKTAAKPDALPKSIATAAPETAPVAAAPSPTRAPAAAVRKAVVARGTDLHDGPSPEARILGTFEGRTNVEVVREEAGYSLVRSPVIGGGSVEGWVRSDAVGAAAAPSTAAAKTAPRPPAKPGAAARPAGAPSKAGDKGPEDILLVPIVGTAKKKPATPFTHKKHWEDYDVECVSCHHKVKALGNVDPPRMTCSEAGCHTATECNREPVPKKNKKCPSFEDAYHMNCITCHKQDGGPTKCAECHTG